MKTTFIYTLSDPITKEVRYVGKSNNPKSRLYVHLSNNNLKSHKTNWVKSLVKKGMKPKLEILDEVLVEEWRFWETYWISQFKSWGFKLTNSTTGGDGCTFSNLTSFKKGHKPWNKGIKGYSTSKKGYKVPQEIRDKISKTLTGKPSKKKRPVTQYDKNMNKIKTFPSITEAVKETSIKSIGNAVTGRSKTAGGYIWL